MSEIGDGTKMVFDIVLHESGMPFNIQLVAQSFLRHTNFVIVFQSVCRDWKKCCRAIEKRLTDRVSSIGMLPAHYLRALKVQYVFPALTYSTVENMQLRTNVSNRCSLPVSAYCFCTICERWKSYKDMYYRSNDLVCEDCAVHRLCTACLTRHRHPRGERCLSCLLVDNRFARPTFCL